MVYPLKASIEKEKVIFNELHDAYQLKSQQFARLSKEPPKTTQVRMEKEAVASYLFEKGTPFSNIQAGFLDVLIKAAEKKGLVVQNFEMLDPTVGQTISEIPVIIRISGKPKDIIDFLQWIKTEKKAIQIKSFEMNKSNQEFLMVLTLLTFRMEK